MNKHSQLQADNMDDDADRSREVAVVRCLMAEDLAAIARIDHQITGRDRGEYLQARFDEALEESAIKVSLVAELDQRVVGFVMARVDFGDFGSMEPVAHVHTIGVEAAVAGQGVGKALLAQLLMNLGALRVDRVETQVSRDNFSLLGFLYRCGFEPAQALAFRKTLPPIAPRARRARID